MRWIIRGISALVLALALLLGVALMLPGERIAKLATDQVAKQTGRALTIDGPVRFSFWPTLGIKADGVQFENAPWSGPQPLMQAERLTIGLDAADLITGTVRITEVSAILPVLNLATNAAGQGNWELNQPETASTSTSEASSEARVFSVEQLALRGATLRYVADGSAPVEFKQVDLDLNWPEPNGTAQIDLRVRPGGEPVHVSGAVGTFSDFLSGADADVALSVVAPGAQMQFKGRASHAGMIDGQAQLDARDPEKALAALGFADVTVPAGLGPHITAAAKTSYAAGAPLTLQDLSLGLGDNKLTGQLELKLGGAVPEITGALTGGALDFSGLSSAPDAGPGGSIETQGWSQAPLDASALARVNGRIALGFDSLKTDAVQFGKSQLNLSLERARAVVEFQPAALFGGTVQGQMVVNNRGGLSVGGDLSFNGILLEQALGETAGFDRLNGEALGAIRYLGAGDSLDAIMNSLSGEGWFEVGKGFFTGFDLEALMKTGGGNGGSTVFDQLSASYTLRDGTLHNDDLVLRLKGVQAKGAGRVMIGAQQLDYLFTPALTTGSGRLLTIPVKITGPWSDPKIRPDLKQALQPKLDAVEERAKEQVREKLSDELEAVIEPDQDLNEVLKDRIEQEAKEQFLKFLSGN